MNYQLFIDLEKSQVDFLTSQFENNEELVEELINEGQEVLKNLLIEEAKKNGTTQLQSILSGKTDFEKSSLYEPFSNKLNSVWQPLIKDQIKSNKTSKQSLILSINFLKTEYQKMGGKDDLQSMATFLDIDYNLLKIANSKVGKWLGKWI